MLPDPTEIGPISLVLRRRREELGFSQTDLATAICLIDRPTVTGNDVARWERGKRIPRVSARRALEEALALPVHVLDAAVSKQKLQRSGTNHEIGQIQLEQIDKPVQHLRTALLDGYLNIPDKKRKPALPAIERQLDQVMNHYQSSRFDQMIGSLPNLLMYSQWLADQPPPSKEVRSYRLNALSLQAAAKVLSKVGEHDLAWSASKQGLATAELADELALVGSLRRSVVHSLQSHGRHESANNLTERTANDLRRNLKSGNDEVKSIYGTLLLAGSMAAARAGDSSAVTEYLDEAEHYAAQMTEPIDHLWTAFGQANVAIHRVATAVAQDDISKAQVSAKSIDHSALPSERRVRFMFDLATVSVKHEEPKKAISTMLEAERLAPEQVYRHKMSQQIVGHLRKGKVGRRDPQLARLDQRIRRELVTSSN